MKVEKARTNEKRLQNSRHKDIYKIVISALIVAKKVEMYNPGIK